MSSNLKELLLTLEHMKLTSYSRISSTGVAVYVHIHVYILQVLSKTVSDLFSYCEGPSMAETQRFVHLSDKFFNCLNVRELNQWRKKRRQI